MSANFFEKQFLKWFETPSQPQDAASEIEQLDIDTPVDPKLERVLHFALRLQDGNLEHRYLLRFEKWLLLDREALQYYADFIELCTYLHFHFRKDRQVFNIESLVEQK